MLDRLRKIEARARRINLTMGTLCAMVEGAKYKSVHKWLQGSQMPKVDSYQRQCDLLHEKLRQLELDLLFALTADYSDEPDLFETKQDLEHAAE